MLLGSVAPFINATSFSGPIQRTLEASLGREVRFDGVHFTLFSGPGFSLENVVIGEDPNYGLEPFAFVPTLEARVRLDKLLFGQMRFASLRLVEPSLNLVKRNDGTWNVVDLAQRLGAPRRGPLNLFPAFEVSDGRIDFKFGTRKTTLYLLDTDVTVYPERSGRLSVQFSGSPARTDRAGNGFGHFRGNVSWYLKSAGAKANQFEADITLDPSNLSELTTLIEGHDAGIHGTISSSAHIQGPATALQVSGELRLGDVHRWDLLPSQGETLRVGYTGGIDLAAHRLNLETVPQHRNQTEAVALRLEVNDFLTRPDWSILAEFDKAPLEALLPLGRRMGLSLPPDFASTGKVNGTVGYSSAAGLGGDIAATDVRATLPNVPALHSSLVKATIFGDRVHIEPATIDTDVGTLEASGDYNLSTRAVSAVITATAFPAPALKSTLQSWFADLPEVGMLAEGNVTGEIGYQHAEAEQPLWSGQFTFANATLKPVGISEPLREAAGRVRFDGDDVEISHLSGFIGKRPVTATYRYSADSSNPAKHPEHVRIDVVEANLNEIEHALDPSLNAQGWLARLRVTERTIPEWLQARDAEIDFVVRRLSIGSTEIGPLSAHILWEGTKLQFTSLRVKAAAGVITAHGSIDVASYSPHCHFTATVSGFPWAGGALSATGEFDTSGTGAESLEKLRATGTFQAQDVSLSPEDTFNNASGVFDFSFANGWPDLRISKLQVSDGDEAWDGEAATQSDGKLILDLEHAGRTRRVVSSLTPQPATAVSSLLGSGRQQ